MTLIRTQQIGFWFLILLSTQLPFEFDTPLFNAGGLAFTNVEIPLLATIGLAAMLVILRKQLILPPRSWVILGGWFCIACLISALLADQLNGNALRATFRTFTGVGLALAVPQLLPSRRHVQLLLAVLIASGCVAVALGWIEVETGQALAFLDALREKPTTVGPFVRLTGPFDYVNQTAMFAEALLPLGIVALIVSDKRKPVWLIALLIICAGIVLSLSRAAWVTAFVIILVSYVLFKFAHGRWQREWLIGAAMFVALFATSTLRYPAFALRLQTETDIAWYDMTMEMPSKLTVEANTEQAIRLTVTNNSLRDYSSSTVVPITVGVRWLDGSTQLSEQRYALDTPLLSGETREIVVGLRPISQTGTYSVQWDLVEETVAWFSDKTERNYLTTVEVLPEPENNTLQPVLTKPRPKPEPLPPDATRLVLWRTAFAMWVDAPLTGVGLDNYRLLYGEWLGQTRWNELLHTNNWYVETIVSLGILGSIPFFGWMALMLNDMRTRMLASADPTIWGIAFALLAFYLHGLLDYFLLFNSTGLLFWLLVGVWFTVRKWDISSK